MGISSILYTARDAIAAQSYGVQVTGQNINNANTVGYVRREAILASRVMGNETFGSVAVDGLRRPADAFLEGRYYSASSLAQAATTRGNQLAITEALFNDLAGSGLGESLDRMASAFGQLSLDPSDAVGRDEVVRALQDFVARANETGQSLATQRNEILGDMKGVVSDINQHASAIAKLNDQIQDAVALGHDAADLKDKRNQELTALASLVDIRVTEGDDGQILVQAAGATLVEGDTARQLSLDLSAEGKVMIFASRPGSSAKTEITSGLSGGALAGLKQVRDSDLTSVMSDLDQYVYDLATSLNTQHAAGYGLDGSTGTPLFDLSSISAPPAGAALGIKVNAAVVADHDLLAASDSSATLPGGGDNAKLLAQLFQSGVVFGGTQTPGEGYASIIGKVGALGASAAQEVALRNAMKTQAFELRESAMGVSMDEEMINLTRYQRAYQAAAKLLSVADELLGELLGIV